MFPKVLLLASALAVSAVPALPAAGAGGINKQENVVYGQAGGHDLLLDLYLPANPPAPRAGRPVVVYFHGGGWRVGSKADGKRIARLLNPEGIAVASVNYRLSGEAIFPAQIMDGKAAVRWVRANARRYGLDPGRIGVCGVSAGGHIAALLGTTEGVKALEDRTQGSPGASSRVEAVCMVSGPVDLTLPTHHFIGKLSLWGEMHEKPAENPALYRAANPSLYVKGGEPPFLIIQGDADKLVIPEHATRMQAALQAHGDDVTLDIVPGGGHVPLQGEKQQAEIAAFFKKYLEESRR